MIVRHFGQHETMETVIPVKKKGDKKKRMPPKTRSSTSHLELNALMVFTHVKG